MTVRIERINKPIVKAVRTNLVKAGIAQYQETNALQKGSTTHRKYHNLSPMGQQRVLENFP